MNAYTGWTEALKSQNIRCSYGHLHEAKYETERCAQHVMSSYRRYILGCKRKFGTARSQVNYKEMLALYCRAKKDLLGRL